MINNITSKRMVIYAVLGAGSLGLTMFGQPSEETSAAVSRAETPAVRITGRAPQSGASASDSTLTANAAAFLTRLAHRSADSKASGDLFATHSWYVAPPPPPPPPPPGPPPPPPPPVAPPLPFTFLGSYAAQGDKPTYFLARGDRIYDIKVGDSVDGVYSLDAAEGTNLIFTYKPLKARQSLSAGGAP